MLSVPLGVYKGVESVDGSGVGCSGSGTRAAADRANILTGLGAGSSSSSSSLVAA